MRAVGILAALLGLVVVVMIATHKDNPALDAAHAFSDNIDEQCDKMMSDAALGNERRLTRQMCDGLKAEAERRLHDARR